jgi:signal transduction histidine kinase
VVLAWGLFISKSIIEAHGGTIWAENNSNMINNGEKRGATFTFTLPIDDIKQVQSNNKQKESSKNR